MFFFRKAISSVAFACLAVVSGQADAAVVTTLSGLQHEGRVDKIGSLNENPLNALRKSGQISSKLIVIIDDDLRRVFISNLRVSSVGKSPITSRQRIRIKQQVAAAGRSIGSVGPILSVAPFDMYGRRIFSMQGPRRPINVIQGITEITPTYTKVQGLLASAFVWDMRIATSSIDRATLNRILDRQIDQEDVDARWSVVKLYLQAERFQDAVEELNEVIRDFPDLAHLKGRSTELRQMLARRMLREIENRRDAGQHLRVDALLSSFPNEGIAGETLLRVRDMLGDYTKQKAQYDRALKLFSEHVDGLKDAAIQEALQRIHQEIKDELSVHTLNRMADYLRLADDASMGTDQKLSLAISGWLLGSGSAIENLAVSLSLVEVRNEVRNYLQASRMHERDKSLQRIQSLEGGTPAYLAKLIANMKPPIETQSEPLDVPGLYQLTAKGIEEQPEFNYYVQLPPEYSPYRRYPCVVTLNGSGTTPLQQIDWWAGTYSEKTLMRMGQAARHGYVVIAPQWTKPFQRKYAYSSREHAAALFCLRDACARVSIDTDRVFLSGHSMGGDAAWDIGLSHPDLWAGVIPIVAHAEKYVKHYKENGRRLPMYFVGGEKDRGWLHENGAQFDTYFKGAGYNTTVVQYQGRGHEHFQDEIQTIFEWMGLSAHRRDFYPREWEVKSMRPWDNFFWWLELNDFPQRSMVFPTQWPGERGTRPIQTSSEILESGRITVRTGARRATVWLSPDMINFARPPAVSVNNREIRDEIKPSAGVLLEDVRTRGDRQHPFWAKVEWRGRRK